MSLSSHVQRSLDHLVLPVTDLATARLRLSALGFSVAPDARHPFGTENACVYFADSTYLEPVGIADLQIYEASAKAGNQFVRRDRAYRFRVAEDGLSAVVFKSDDAATDREAFKAEGFDVGDLFEFSRPFENEDGSQSTAGFKLAFAADLRVPDLFFFTCQRLLALSPPEALLAHPNGVTGISEVMVGEDAPMEFEPLLQAITNSQNIEIHPDSVTVDATTSKISVCSHDIFNQRFELERGSEGRGLQARAVVFEVADLANIRDILTQNTILHQAFGNMILVPPALGQGVAFIFREE